MYTLRDPDCSSELSVEAVTRETPAKALSGPATVAIRLESRKDGRIQRRDERVPFVVTKINYRWSDPLTSPMRSTQISEASISVVRRPELKVFTSCTRGVVRRETLDYARQRGRRSNTAREPLIPSKLYLRLESVTAAGPNESEGTGEQGRRRGALTVFLRALRDLIKKHTRYIGRFGIFPGAAEVVARLSADNTFLPGRSPHGG